MGYTPMEYDPLLGKSELSAELSEDDLVKYKSLKLKEKKEFVDLYHHINSSTQRSPDEAHRTPKEAFDLYLTMLAARTPLAPRSGGRKSKKNKRKRCQSRRK
jgi:hypothetical protein